MKSVNLALDLFRDISDDRLIAEDELILQKCLDILTLRNVQWLLRHPETPLLYDPEVYPLLGLIPPPGLQGSGIYYQLEPDGEENFDSWPKILRMSSGDCDDLSAARAAEAIVRFNDPLARAFFVGEKTSPTYMSYHVMVRRGDGIIEDPSLILGMGETPEMIRADLEAKQQPGLHQAWGRR